MAPVRNQCPVVDGGGDLLVPGFGVSWGKPEDRSQLSVNASTVARPQLVLNLTRIHLFAQNGMNESVAQHLVRETQFFIEWVVPDFDLVTDIAFATELVDLQRLLSRWKLDWSVLWADESQRQESAIQAWQWCDYLVANVNC